jgi:hypothetical protein
MSRIRCAVFAAACILAAPSAFAQIAPPPPELQNRIPAPLPPPPEAPAINGPLGQSPPPGVYQPRRLETHSDRTVQCLHEGSGYGLRGRRLQSYARACANAN